jgi:hypothetical protein
VTVGKTCHWLRLVDIRSDRGRDGHVNENGRVTKGSKVKFGVSGEGCRRYRVSGSVRGIGEVEE